MFADVLYWSSVTLPCLLYHDCICLSQDHSSSVINPHKPAKTMSILLHTLLHITQNNNNHVCKHYWDCQQNLHKSHEAEKPVIILTWQFQQGGWSTHSRKVRVGDLRAEKLKLYLYKFELWKAHDSVKYQFDDRLSFPFLIIWYCLHLLFTFTSIILISLGLRGNQPNFKMVHM